MLHDGGCRYCFRALEWAATLSFALFNVLVHALLFVADLWQVFFLWHRHIFIHERCSHDQGDRFQRDRSISAVRGGSARGMIAATT